MNKIKLRLAVLSYYRRKGTGKFKKLVVKKISSFNEKSIYIHRKFCQLLVGTNPHIPKRSDVSRLHRYISIYETGLWEPWGWSMAIEKTSGCYVCSEIIRAEVILPHHLLKRDDDEVLALIWFVVHPYPLLPPGAAREPPPPMRRAAPPAVTLHSSTPKVLPCAPPRLTLPAAAARAESPPTSRPNCKGDQLTNKPWMRAPNQRSTETSTT